MEVKLILWDIYEVRAQTTSLNGVMLRGRLRKLCLNHHKNVLVENTTDYDNGVRFAIIHNEDPQIVLDFVRSLGEDVTIQKISDSVANPVLSKLTVNNESRYKI